ncbi:MAG: response regulator [Lachnospiraceae bacterium]|nr:response regulator [Lachnospiraceae bacterium]
MSKEIKDKRSKIMSIAVAGCLVIALILTIGTLGLGRIAGDDTKEAVRNVSLLYLGELAERREQIVSSALEEYINDLDVALGLIDRQDLSSIENLQKYQLRMKQLYNLDKFAFVDTEGIIYTSRGTRNDIADYGIVYDHMTDPVIFVKNPKSKDKKVIIAVPADNLHLEDKVLVTCFMEMDMDNLLKRVSLQSNNNTTFCNIYTSDGIALTDMVLGGLASEDNLLDAMKRAKYENGYSYDDLIKDFEEHNSGVVSFTYNDINETLHYVPIHGTDWMLTYLIRESIIGEQINSISRTIILRSVIQSILLAIVLVIMFLLIMIQQKQASKAVLDREIAEMENRMKQEELEEQIAMQEELSVALKSAEDANRAKSGFVSNMSHEIRTPITAILGMNEMIRRESTDENILAYANNIDKAGASLLGIISDILDFSKIEAGHMELVPGEYSLPEILGDLYNLVQFRAEAKGLDLKIIAEPTLPVGLVGDELRVKQIIANLLTNAIKYTERGCICLEVKCSGKDEANNRIRLSVSVSDTGIGIRKEEMDKLFVPFDRIDLEHNRSIEGTGLGLSITRQLLLMMDSELLVESTYGKGSRFYFDIWQEVSEPDEIGDFDPVKYIQVAEPVISEKEIFTAPGKRILVVDDMSMNLQVLTGLLKRSKMTIDTASSGEECITKFSINDYDIVFLDYRMPGLDGVRTLRRLKEMYPEKAGKTPIISLTASAVAGDRERLIDAGFTDYLSKPVNISDMESMLSRYLGEGEVLHGQENTTSDKDDIVSDGDEDILSAISEIKELDIKSGLSYCGDAEDYVFALQTYASSVSEKADQIEKSLEEKDSENYILLVHSLKSLSGSIGAKDLRDRAAGLEQAAKSGDLEVLKEDTASFLRDYRALGAEIDKIQCRP